MPVVNPGHLLVLFGSLVGTLAANVTNTTMSTTASPVQLADGIGKSCASAGTVEPRMLTLQLQWISAT